MSGSTDRPAARLSKGERTRARILDSAGTLFAKSGFHAVSLRDIAAHAGLTHAGLLHHFPGKETLLIETLERRDDYDADLLFRADPPLASDQLLKMIVAVVERNAGTPGLVGLFAKISAEAADPDHPAHGYFVQRYRALRERLAAALASLVEQHTLTDIDPELAARQLIALMDGLQTQWLLEPGTVDMRTAVADFLVRLGLDVGPTPLFPAGIAGAASDIAARSTADAPADAPADSTADSTAEPAEPAGDPRSSCPDSSKDADERP